MNRNKISFVIGLVIGVVLIGLAGLIGKWLDLAAAAIVGFGFCWHCGWRPMIPLALGVLASGLLWSFAAIKFGVIVLIIMITSSGLLTALVIVGTLVAYKIRKSKGYVTD